MAVTWESRGFRMTSLQEAKEIKIDDRKGDAIVQIV